MDEKCRNQIRSPNFHLPVTRTKTIQIFVFIQLVTRVYNTPTNYGFTFIRVPVAYGQNGGNRNGR